MYRSCKEKVTLEKVTSYPTNINVSAKVKKLDVYDELYKAQIIFFIVINLSKLLKEI